VSIKVYLSAVRHFHILKGLHDSFSQQLTPWLQIILKGIKKHQVFLTRLDTLSYTRILPTQKLDCGQCVALPFLASYISVSLQQYQGKTHMILCVTYPLGYTVAIDSRDNPRLLQVIIKQSKTDLFKKVSRFTWVPQIVSSAQSELCYHTWLWEVAKVVLSSFHIWHYPANV